MTAHTGVNPTDCRSFVHKRIFGAAKGFVTGGVRGAVGGFITGGRRGRARPPPGRMFQQQQGPLISRTQRQIGPAGVFGRSVTERFQARGQVEQFRGVRAQAAVTQDDATVAAMMACGTGKVGTHLNRSGYFVQIEPGNPAAGGRWIEKESICVANRSRNAGNGRAVVRATSRVASFDRLARRVRKQMKAACR